MVIEFREREKLRVNTIVTINGTMKGVLKLK